MPTKRNPFMTARAYPARVKLLSQWERYLSDPLTQPEPDFALRLIDAAAGAKAGATTLRDLRDDALVVGATFHRDHYVLDPLDDLALDLGTAFGPTFSCGANGAHPCIREVEQTGPMIRLSRLFIDVRPIGAALRRNSFAGPFARYSLRRRDLAPIAADGHQSHAPVQRDDFLHAAAAGWAMHCGASGIRVGLAEHIGNVRRAFRAADLAFATPGAREPDHGFMSLGACASAVLHRVGNTIPA